MVEEHKEEHVHHESEHHHPHEEHKEHSGHHKTKLNLWMISALGLVVLLIISVITSGFGFFNFGELSSEEASEKALAFVNNNLLQGQSVAQIVDLSEENGAYKMTLSISGQELDTYVSKDGELFFPQALPITSAAVLGANTASTATIPKTDKPQVELYVWGYCPYGVQAQGPLAEVAALLGTEADFEIVPYYDGHGEYETQQNQIQSCIQKLYTDKYWSYAAKFVSDVYPKCSSARTVECDKTESEKIMTALGIDSAKVMSCVSTEGEALFTAAAAKAQENSVQGSPTIIINGVTANVGRTAEAYKTAICGAFNTAPEACAETLSTTAGSASGSC